MESGLRRLGGTGRIGGAVARMAQAVGRVMFPHFCLSCGKEGRLLCAECEAARYAPARGILFSACRSVSCFAAGRYADPVLRTLLHLYKYERVSEAGEALLRIFSVAAARQPSAVLVASDDPIVVPVPLHPVRLAMRGFNQAEELARVLAADFELELAKKAIRRRLSWRPQAGLSGVKNRTRNVAGAFYGASADVENMDIVLVDDVYTTGATIRECAEALRAAGARQISAVVLMKG